MTTPSILITGGKEHICTATVGSNRPDNFRLAKAPDGELFLQGRFTSQCMVCGWSKEEWVDLPTFVLPVSPKTSRWQNFRKFIRSFLP